ncbi:MAG: efflux RND transporter permease subunit [Treponema sp.]|nr:efflux RND transporter permease subunit [Treponema sp.]
MSLSKLTVSKPTTIVIIFIVLTALGIYSTTKLPTDLFPDIELPYIIVSTSYPNAGPQEVERSVSRTLESTLSSITGLKNLMSYSSTGTSVVMLELNYGTNLDAATNEIRDRIDLVRNFLPSDTTSPIIFKMDPAMMPIMGYVVIGNRTPEELRQYTEDIIRPKLEQIDGVASANITGGREKAIRIEIPRDRLEAYSLTITQIAQMIGAQNIQGSGGEITEGDLNYTITTSGEYKNLNDIRNTVISYKPATSSSPYAMPQLKSIKLRDIADVYEGYKDEDTLAYINGKPCVMVRIQKQSGKNSVQTAEKVKKIIPQIQKDLPNDVLIEEYSNTTDIISDTISSVASSAIEGALIAILVVFIFLRSIKSTIIIGLSIPISLIITLGIMYFTGNTLNMMTLAGLTLGVGMLVDNSIVMLENIYSYRERGTKASIAAVLGSQEMIMAISASTLTTICVFLPLIMYGNELGMIGQVFEGLTFTIVVSLVCSLIVAIVLVPVLASKYLKLENIYNPDKKKSIIGHALDKLDDLYEIAVRKVLKYKKTTIAIIIIIFIASLLYIPKLGFEFMPQSASNEITLNLEMPKGTKLDVTEQTIRTIESFAMQDLKGVEKFTVSVGGGGMMASSSSSSSASLTVKLYPLKERKKDWDNDITTKEKLRKYFTQFPGVSFSFSDTNMGIPGGGIDIVIKSNDLDLARKTSSAVEDVLKNDLKDIISESSSDLEEGLPQVDIVIDRDRMYSLGLNTFGVSNEIKANINGVTASRYNDKGNEIDIIVSLAEKDKTKLNDLEQIFVNNAQGMRIPLVNFAQYRESTSPVSIRRENQSRTIHITAKQIPGLDLAKVHTTLQKTIMEKIPQDENVTIEIKGDFEDLMKNMKLFTSIIIMAVILVFAVMASQFESFLDPFIVLFTIPLSVIGIVIIYALMGSKINIITAVGMLVLVGVIVNNGIILVDYTNLLRKRGYELNEACVAAAKSRLRPILMTTLTTVFGLVPMAFSSGDGSEMVQPIGQTVLGGLTFGTIMTLFLMPTLYYIFNKRKIVSIEKKKERTLNRLERRAKKTVASKQIETVKDESTK